MVAMSVELVNLSLIGELNRFLLGLSSLFLTFLSFLLSLALSFLLLNFFLLLLFDGLRVSFFSVFFCAGCFVDFGDCGSTSRKDKFISMPSVSTAVAEHNVTQGAFAVS